MNSSARPLAPVLITVYNRKEHLQRAITSLLRCKEAKDTVVYISSDAAGRPEDESAIREVRLYIERITGFGRVVSLFHQKNLGLQRSYEAALRSVFLEHDSFIFLEDDIEVSPDFLAYMSDALHFYKNDHRIFCVSAFSFSCLYPDTAPASSKEVYFVNRFVPWGFASWRSRMIQDNIYSLSHVRESLQETEFVRRLNKNGSDLFPSFATQVARGKMLVLDYLNTYHMVRNDLYTVVPYTSKTFNHGHDGSGTRTKRNTRFLNVDTGFLDQAVGYRLEEFRSDKVNYRILQEHFVNWRNRAKYILWRIGLLSFVVSITDNVQAIQKR